MSARNDKWAGLFLLFFIFSLPNVFALEKPFDHSVWDRFLKQYVNEKGEVNYVAVKKDPVLLKQYLRQLRKIRQIDLKEWPREELLALWLNAYNAALIRKVLKYYPIKSVHDVPGFWEEDALLMAGGRVGLNQIRSDVLLGSFRDEKIHAVLSYAARGGPKLSRDAFTGPAVDGQLYQAARRFVNDPERNAITVGKKTISISKIFQWYAGDFALDYAIFENDKGISRREYPVVAFLAHYLDDDAKVHYLEDGKFKIQYRLFDWTLNDWKPAR